MVLPINIWPISHLLKSDPYSINQLDAEMAEIDPLMIDPDVDDVL